MVPRVPERTKQPSTSASISPSPRTLWLRNLGAQPTEGGAAQNEPELRCKAQKRMEGSCLFPDGFEGWTHCLFSLDAEKTNHKEQPGNGRQGGLHCIPALSGELPVLSAPPAHLYLAMQIKLFGTRKGLRHTAFLGGLVLTLEVCQSIGTQAEMKSSWKNPEMAYRRLHFTGEETEAQEEKASEGSWLLLPTCKTPETARPAAKHDVGSQGRDSGPPGWWSGGQTGSCPSQHLSPLGSIPTAD